MQKTRRLVGPVALVWLVFHLSVVSGTAALLLTSGTAAAEVVCTCTHGDDHGSCPMHGAPSDSARCRLQSTQTELGLALLSTLGPLTLPVVSADVIAMISAPLSRGYGETWPVDWTAPPDAPPPRS